ncbi:MAG: hypothetical protein LBK63_06905 [Treponema sp.]|nr:hypothetical protein [Treponema sp.]
MIGETKKPDARNMNLLKLCPACGKTAHTSRKYCDCHADLRQATFIESTNPPQVEKINFESPGLTCNDCPEDCKYCFSFAEPDTNRDGFGGKDCRHQMTGTARCYCCQGQVKIAENFHLISFVEVARAVMERRRAEGNAEALDGENLFQEAAGVIWEQMTEPIRNRINQALQRVG